MVSKSSSRCSSTTEVRERRTTGQKGMAAALKTLDQQVKAANLRGGSAWSRARGRPAGAITGHSALPWLQDSTQGFWY